MIIGILKMREIHIMSTFKKRCKENGGKMGKNFIIENQHRNKVGEEKPNFEEMLTKDDKAFEKRNKDT